MGLSVADRGSNDPLFGRPFVDIDEWGEEPVRHRFVHGGFEGTDARFAVHFPPPERYQGRPRTVACGIHAPATGRFSASREIRACRGGSAIVDTMAVRQYRDDSSRW